MSTNSILPPGWIIQFDASSGRNFYVDTTTGISHWHLPAGTTAAVPVQQTVQQTEQLPSYEQVESEFSTKQEAESPVTCPICSKQVSLGIINQHIESNCELVTFGDTQNAVGFAPAYGQKNQGCSQIQEPYGSSSYAQQAYGNGGAGYAQQQAYGGAGYGQQQTYGQGPQYQGQTFSQQAYGGNQYQGQAFSQQAYGGNQYQGQASSSRPNKHNRPQNARPNRPQNGLGGAGLGLALGSGLLGGFMLGDILDGPGGFF
jgi:WW domain